MNNLEQQLNTLESKVHLLDSLSDYVIEIGIVSGESKERILASLGLTNAELMFIHENGSPLNNIPARPVLQMALTDAANSMLPKLVDKISDGVMNNNWTKEKIELELGRFCMRLQNYARDIIYSNDGRLAPNAPSVAKRKKGNHPLFDTGQLARSIICRFVKK